MKRNLITAGFLSMMVFVCATSAYAVPIDGAGLNTWTGQYVGTFTGNNDTNDTSFLLNELNAWLAVHDPMALENLDFFDKAEEENNFSAEKLTVAIAPDSDNFFGAWETTDLIQAYVVKGGPEYALYWLGLPGANDGYWSMVHLQNRGGNTPELSHLDAYTTAVAPVPEPATVLLLGTGLIGIWGYSRRKLKK